MSGIKGVILAARKKDRKYIANIEPSVNQPVSMCCVTGALGHWGTF